MFSWCGFVVSCYYPKSSSALSYLYYHFKGTSFLKMIYMCVFMEKQYMFMPFMYIFLEYWYVPAVVKLSSRYELLRWSSVCIFFQDSHQFCWSGLTHWGRERMAAILQTTFSNALSWMIIYEFRLKFHWSLFPRFQLTIFQHWFRQWLGVDQAASHYLNHWWLDYWPIYVSLGLNELMQDASVSYAVHLRKI